MTATVLRELWAFLVGGDPAVHPKTRLGRALPTIGLIAAFLATAQTIGYVNGNTTLGTGPAVVVAVASCLPIALIASRPLLAWRIAFVTAVLTGPVVHFRHAGAWPWHPIQFISFWIILAVVAVRHRAGVVIWTGLSASLLIPLFVNPQNVAGLLVAVFAVLLVGFLVARSRQARRQLADVEERSALVQARRALAEERNRIAREMHDVVAHHMSLVAVRAETAVYRIEGVPPAVAEELAAIASISREALTEMRRLLGVLRSDAAPLTTPQPGLKNLTELVDQAREAGVDVVLWPVPQGKVPAGTELAAFRIVQEALSNARRHAAGALVRIWLTLDDEALTVQVHSGPGVRAPEADERGPDNGERHGLLGMRERAVAVGGTLMADPTPSGGFEVLAKLPTKEDARSLPTKEDA